MSVVLTAVTGLLGNFPLEAGGSLKAIVSVPGATVATMTVEVAPQTYPGDGFTWQGYVNAPDEVTVVITSAIANYLQGSIYNIVVLTGSGGGGGSGPTLETNGTANGSQVLLNLQQGTGVTLVDNGSGTVTATAAGVQPSGTLTLDLPVFGAGGSTVKVGTKSGNTDELVTQSGAATSGEPLLYDANGNAIAGTKRGNTTTVQMASSSANPTTNDIASFDAAGNVQDSGVLVSSLFTSPLTTKGDLMTFAGGNVRLPVGSNGQVLTADSTQTDGVKWAAAAGGSLAIIGPNINTPIVPANWTTAGTAGTRTDLTGAITCIGNAGGAGTTNIFGVTTPVSAGDFTHYVAFYANVLNGNFFPTVHAAFTDGAKFEGAGLQYVSSAPSTDYSSVESTAYSGGAFAAIPGSLAAIPGANQAQLVIVRLTRTGTTLSAAISADNGFSYPYVMFTDAVPFLTCDAILVYCDPRQCPVAPSFTLVSFV